MRFDPGDAGFFGTNRVMLDRMASRIRSSSFLGHILIFSSSWTIDLRHLLVYIGHEIGSSLYSLCSLERRKQCRGKELNMKNRQETSGNKITLSPLKAISQAITSSTICVALLFIILAISNNGMTEVTTQYESVPSNSNPSTIISSDSITYFLPIIFKIEPQWRGFGGSASGGGISNSSAESYGPSLAIASNGMLYVAWEETSIVVKRWNGDGWERLGTSPSEHSDGLCYGPSGWPSLAVAPDNMPYVAWTQTGYQCFGQVGGMILGHIFVSRWNGNAWEEIGNYSYPVGAAHRLSLAIAPDGTPYIAWYLLDDAPDIYVKRWDGHNWQEIGTGSASGGGISNTGAAFDPSLAIAPDGTPYVAWTNRTATGTYPEENIYIRRWDGTHWSEVGTGSASGGGISNASDSDEPSVAIASDGTPYVAWKYSSNMEGDIYVRSWNGHTWEEVGPGSASAGGISNTSYTSNRPSLKVMPNNMPCAAWGDTWTEGNVSGNDSVYIRCWNGSSWSEVGAGSASGVGISNGDSAGGPSLGIAKDATPYVAWQNLAVTDDPSNWEIYVKGWLGLCPPSVTGVSRK
jgi:hypothetical protein